MVYNPSVCEEPARTYVVADALLATKLYKPAVRPGRIARPRLLTRLDEAQSRRLALVSAPAGFGKTTLVSTWLEDREPVGWFSVDEGDNDPVRFLSYFVAALQQVDGGIGQSLQRVLNSPQLPSTESAMTMLINDIVGVDRPLILVLDDYHLIDSRYVHEVLRFLLENQPPTMHVIIVTREDPPFSLANLRARGQLVELRADDLRFTPEETLRFLRDSMGLDVSADIAAILEQRTEGWAAGLQMAALSLKDQGDIGRFVDSFGGSDVFVLDYLTEEVLRRQPEHVQAFLLQTSILDRLHAPLCDAVTGRDDSQAMLETLQQENLFLIPLDNRRLYYRYYHLFLDVLRSHLNRKHASLIPDLHRRAARWYAGHAMFEEAIDHALKGQDYEEAVGMLEQVAEDTLMRGEALILRRWLESLPEDVILSSPHLCIFHALTLLLAWKQPAVEARLQAANAQGTLTGEVAAVKSLISVIQETSDQVVAYAQQALEHLPESSVLLRDLAHWSIALGHYLGGDEATAHRLLTEATVRSNARGNVFIALLALYLLAVSQMAQGYLNRVEELYRQMVSIVDLQERRIIFSGLASLAYGDLLRERGDLEGAERYLEEGIALSRQFGTPVLLVNVYTDLARTKHSQGDVEAAFDLINRAEQHARQEGAHPFAMVQLETFRIQFLIAANRLSEVEPWLAERTHPDRDLPYTLYPDVPFVCEMESFTLVRVLLAQGRHAEAAALVEHTLEMAYVPALRIEGLLLKALVLHAAGEPEAAFSALGESLMLAEPEGFCRLFADEGPAMDALLRDYLKASRAAPAVEQYARYLLANIEAPTRPHEAPRRQAPVLVEPLSDRERDILALVADGLTNQEIALRLSLSLNTVKWHLYNAYSKLSVRNRTEAVTRARELGLLPS